MNLAIIDTLLWCKTWQHSGYNHTFAKQKLLRKRKRAHKSSWSRRGNQKSFTLTIPQNLANLVKTFPGFIVRQHRTARKQMGLLKEQCAELRKGHLRYCCNQVWTMNGGRIPRKVAAICETFKISCLVRRHFMRGGSEYHSKARSFRFGVVAEYHTISVKDLWRLHQFGKKVLPGMFFGYVLYAGRIWKGDILVADIEELIGGDGRLRNPCKKTQCKGSVKAHEW